MSKNVYKEAVFSKVTVNVNSAVLGAKSTKFASGNYTPQKLTELDIDVLDRLAVATQEEVEKSKGKSFISKTTTKDKALKVKFDLVLDILNTKVELMNKASEAADKKKHNDEIDALIYKKEKEQLGDLSVEELRKLKK